VKSVRQNLFRIYISIRNYRKFESICLFGLVAEETVSRPILEGIPAVEFRNIWVWHDSKKLCRGGTKVPKRQFASGPPSIEGPSAPIPGGYTLRMPG
jgi:hypothetical protein